MIKNFKNKKGFTLVELLISMMIFVVFITVLMGSYMRLVQAQREANDYRILYSEARVVFDRISDELKNGAIYYGDESVNPIDYKVGHNEVKLVAKDGSYVVLIMKNADDVGYCRAKVDGSDVVKYILTPQTKINQFDIYVSPAGDPYKAANVEGDSFQFQSKITVDAVFSKDISNKEFTLPLRTTVSSRFYSVSPYDNKPGNSAILGAFGDCKVQLTSLSPNK